MKYRQNGSVQSGNVPTVGNRKERVDNRLYRCMVTDIKFTDNQLNITGGDENPRVMYDVIVIGGPMAGRVINNCRTMNQYASKYSYFERTLRKSSKKVGEVRLSEHDGEVVFVKFIQGNVLYPVIIGCDESLQITNSPEAKRDEAPREIKEFNGVRMEINNKGEWIVTRAGKKAGVSQEGKFEPNLDTILAQLQMVENNIIFKDQTKTFTMENPEEFYLREYKTGLSIKEDGKNDKITTTFAGGLVMEVDGNADKVTITTSGGSVIEVDGAGNKITMDAGGTTIEIDGASGKISVKGDFIDLGKSVSDFVTKFNQLATAFNTHTHIVPQAPAGALPSNPPTLPLLVSVGSQTVQVQD